MLHTLFKEIIQIYFKKIQLLQKSKYCKSEDIFFTFSLYSRFLGLLKQQNAPCLDEQNPKIKIFKLSCIFRITDFPI